MSMPQFNLSDSHLIIVLAPLVASQMPALPR
jgi:hypothetical protein